MKIRLSSFIFLLSSFVLLLAFGGTADAQWIIDGQQVQTLNLNVSDPQALYSDGSREMEARLHFSSEVSDNTGLFRATVPWDEAECDFFIFDSDEEWLDFCTQDGLGLLFGNLYIKNIGLFDYGTGLQVNFEEASLNGGWRSDTVLNESGAIINRGYADSRYLRQGVDLAAPLVFSPSLTATSGMIRATIPWAGDSEFFVFNEDEEILKLSSSGNLGLQIGAMFINQGGIAQTAEGTAVDFGEHMLSGGWQIDEVLPYSEAIISRGYADTRYLQRTEGITTNRVIQAGDTLVISNGLITAINP